MSSTTENIKLSRWFSYTPHIYTKENQGWKTHIQIFIAIQLLPLIVTAAFTYLEEGTEVAFVNGFLAPLFSTWYYILTAINIGILVLAVYENKKYAYQLKKVSVEEKVGDHMISEIKPE